MNVWETIHDRHVHSRRVRVLTRELSSLLPDRGCILDIGCGDGLLGSLVQMAKPDTSVTGIDVLVRREATIPVQRFDGRKLPFADRACDAVMLIDVLHHTDEPIPLLREASRVARELIVIKDHLLEGIGAGATLRFMDRVGNRRHNVALPHNYWAKEKWLEVFGILGVEILVWKSKLALYPPPANWLFGRSLHFVAQLAVPKSHHDAPA